MLLLEIEKCYDEFNLNKGWQADKGEIVALFGPSGSGKSLTLKAIAGLETPDKGLIKINSRLVFHHQKKINIPARDRSVAYVPQNYGLFPHMTVVDNILFGMNGNSQEPKKKKTMELLQRVGLESKWNRYPGQLSGGEKQRVALLRALANNPKVLLLDEPFSAVDIPAREILRNEIREFLAQWRIPIVLVTHDPGDLNALATRVIEYGNTNKPGCLTR